MNRDAFIDLVSKYQAVIIPTWYASEYDLHGVPVVPEHSDIVTGDVTWEVTDKPSGMTALLSKSAAPGALIYTRRYYGAESQYGAIDAYVLGGFVPARFANFDDDDDFDDVDEFTDYDEIDDDDE